MIQHSGGRAGIHERKWIKAGYNKEDLEPLRQQLLTQNDIGQVQKALEQVEIYVNRRTLQTVKKYNFDSRGIGFVHGNYQAWRKLATGQGTIGNVCYLIHEITEIKELQRIQRKTGFNFMGPKNWRKLSPRQIGHWRTDFDRYYRQAHSKALKAEYEFLAEQIAQVTNHRVKISKFQAAAIDPTRLIEGKTEDTEAARHMFIGGLRMKEHPHFNAWRARIDEVVSISTSTQQRLGYQKAEITLKKLIWYLKEMSIK